MGNYRFRVRFRLSHNRVLDSDEQTLNLYSHPGGMYVLGAADGTSLRESQWLLIKDVGNGFASQEEAAEASRHVKDAVMWWGAKERVGVDVGDDTTHAVWTQTGLDMMGEERGSRVLNDVHGLQVYEEDSNLPTEFVWSTAEAQLRKSLDTFEQSFREAVDLSLELTESETLAFELYGLSHFESAERARFVTLVTAIESISKPKARSPQAVEHVERLIELTRTSELTTPEVSSLVDSLGYLRQESISRTGREFVGKVLHGRKYGGRTAKGFFHDCYTVRSDLVHEGKPQVEMIDLRALVSELDRLVADLLLASAGRSDT